MCARVINNIIEYKICILILRLHKSEHYIYIVIILESILIIIKSSSGVFF